MQNLPSIYQARCQPLKVATFPNHIFYIILIDLPMHQTDIGMSFPENPAGASLSIDFDGDFEENVEGNSNTICLTISTLQGPNNINAIELKDKKGNIKQGTVNTPKGQPHTQPQNFALFQCWPHAVKSITYVSRIFSGVIVNAPKNALFNPPLIQEQTRTMVLNPAPVSGQVNEPQLLLYSGEALLQQNVSEEFVKAYVSGFNTPGLAAEFIKTNPDYNYYNTTDCFTL